MIIISYYPLIKKNKLSLSKNYNNFLNYKGIYSIYNWTISSYYYKNISNYLYIDLKSKSSLNILLYNQINSI